MPKGLVVRMGAGILIFAGATYSLNKGASETYQLQDADKAVFAACKRGFNAADVEPKATSVSVYDACACIAKHATSELDPAELGAYADTQKSLTMLGAASLDNADLTDDEIEDALNPERIMKRHKMDDVSYMRLTLSAMTHQSTCLDAETHTGEALERVAALRPKSTPAPQVAYREDEVDTASTDVLSGLRR